MPEPFDFVAEVRELVAPIRVVDVGAMELGDGATPYDALIANGLGTVVGFEPQEDECQKLNDRAKPGRRFLPYALGDGSMRTFHLTHKSMTSSLYEPNAALLKRFSGLAEMVEIAREIPMQTHRLDDLADLGGCDYLKVDVQGAELDVIRGGEKTLRGALVAELEVEFVELYKGQPLFADIDRAMRELGFTLYNFQGQHTLAFAPLHRKKSEPFKGQIVWSDAIYFRDFMRLTELEVVALLKLCVIAHVIYGARDFVLSALHVVEEKGGPRLYDSYSMATVGVVKPRPDYR
jgi:FkbM family methyltransferase